MAVLRSMRRESARRTQPRFRTRSFPYPASAPRTPLARSGSPLPEETMVTCKASEAVLLAGESPSLRSLNLRLSLRLPRRTWGRVDCCECECCPTPCACSDRGLQVGQAAQRPAPGEGALGPPQGSQGLRQPPPRRRPQAACGRVLSQARGGSGGGGMRPPDEISGPMG